jgi:hypothetical protein
MTVTLILYLNGSLISAGRNPVWTPEWGLNIYQILDASKGRLAREYVNKYTIVRHGR